jgi:hypothetical protein
MGAAAAPMLIGSAIGGLTNRKNPLQGALLGGALGGAGGAFMGQGGLSSMFGSFADDAATGILPSALSGSTTVNPLLPNNAVQAFTTGAPMATPLNVEAMKTVFAGSPTAAPFVSSGTSTGMIPSSLYEPTMMDRFADVGKYAQSNKTLTAMGMQSAQQMMQQEQPQFAPAGQVRSGQIQGGDYMSLLNPQQGTVLRPQPISLLG